VRQFAVDPPEITIGIVNGCGNVQDARCRSEVLDCPGLPGGVVVLPAPRVPRGVIRSADRLAMNRTIDQDRGEQAERVAFRPAGRAVADVSGESE
jgi:hypothetical protein